MGAVRAARRTSSDGSGLQRALQPRGACGSPAGSAIQLFAGLPIMLWWP